MKDTFTLEEVNALIAAAMQIARAQERQWDANADRARRDWSGDAYNREYVKGISEGYSYALNDFQKALDQKLKLETQ